MRSHPITVTLVAVVTLLIAGVVGYRLIVGEEYSPRITIQPAATTSLRPFVVGPTT